MLEGIDEYEYFDSCGQPAVWGPYFEAIHS